MWQSKRRRNFQICQGLGGPVNDRGMGAYQCSGEKDAAISAGGVGLCRHCSDGILSTDHDHPTFVPDFWLLLALLPTMTTWRSPRVSSCLFETVGKDPHLARGDNSDYLCVGHLESTKPLSSFSGSQNLFVHLSHGRYIL